MNACKLERALGIIEGVSWVIEDQAVADSLQAAVGMIEEAVEENKDGPTT
ncbi:MAG: hypothetical protein IJW45_08335 [Oscillospiraceae bacterium]|nr:hypothetical protein [Oscillospiraceae bacterium]